MECNEDSDCDFDFEKGVCNNDHECVECNASEDCGTINKACLNERCVTMRIDWITNRDLFQ